MDSRVDRSFPRLRRALAVEFNGSPGRTWDVSLGGFSAEAHFAPRAGTAVYGSIALGRQRFSYAGQVIWTHSRSTSKYSRFGVRFNSVEFALLQSLRGELPALAG